MAPRPRIGITMRLEMATGRFYLHRAYSEAVEASGGLPIQIPLIPKQDVIKEIVSELDGILLPGCNTDPDPALYGEEPHQMLRTVMPVKDQTDLLVLAEAEKRGLPVFGICYGMQILNVSRGGSLIQDIQSQVHEALKHDQGEPYDRNSHTLTVERSSWLASLEAATGVDGRLRVNSSHHQSVRNIGRDLRATAWATDGVVECIEDTRDGRFVVGVQWHPELTFATDDLSKELFGKFVENCAERKVRAVNA